MSGRGTLFGRADDGPRIKVCGLMRPCDIHAANEAKIDLAGFIVDVPLSRRSVAPDEVRKLTAQLDPSIAAVGVFVNAPIEKIGSLADDGVIDVVQLHGVEDDGYIADLRRRLDVPVMQAFCIASLDDVRRACASRADMVLLDNGSGGTGEVFDWRLAGYMDRPFMLAGGLGPDNVAEAVRTTHPWGVDMNSGVETDGRKDRQKIVAAVAAVRSMR